MVAAVGKQVAGTEAFRPRWSPAPACLRKPWGPSARKMAGIPFLLPSQVVQVLQPCRSAAFSSSVSF